MEHLSGHLFHDYHAHHASAGIIPSRLRHIKEDPAGVHKRVLSCHERARCHLCYHFPGVVREAAAAWLPSPLEEQPLVCFESTLSSMLVVFGVRWTGSGKRCKSKVVGGKIRPGYQPSPFFVDSSFFRRHVDWGLLHSHQRRTTSLP